MPATRQRSTPARPQERARRPVNGKTGPEVAPGSLRHQKARTPQNRGPQGLATERPQESRGPSVPVTKPRGTIAPDNNGDNPVDNKAPLCLLAPVNNKAYDTPVRHPEYRLTERVFLTRGDKIRVSQGPYYVSRDTAGHITRMKLAEGGVMTFIGYCELGNTRWIEAHGKSGFAALRVSSDDGGGSALMPGFVRRPYKITKARPRKAWAKACSR